MKKLILTLFLCLSAIFYAACNVNVTDYFSNTFGEDKENAIFFLDIEQYNEKNILFMKDNVMYVNGQKSIGTDPTQFAYLDNGYYIQGGFVYFLDKKLMPYSGKIDSLRTYATHNTKIDKSNSECKGEDIGKNDFYLKMVNGKVLYKNGIALGKK
ncbi:MAG: hypothetical protein KBF12_07215 [Sebaldella sp.]|jgi:hypothetical protein|nr:hypothetical protein [Sebaldella sp.]